MPQPSDDADFTEGLDGDSFFPVALVFLAGAFTLAFVVGVAVGLWVAA